jgi:selenocysteine lyase/cysteine desulfurase
MCDFNAALISGWIKALEFIEELGQENIERAIKKNVNYLKRRLSGIRGLNVLTPRAWEKSAGLISIEIEGKNAETLFGRLLKKGIVARYTHDPSYLRISVNYFNTREELDQLAEALRQLSAT